MLIKLKVYSADYRKIYCKDLRQAMNEADKSMRALCRYMEWSRRYWGGKINANKYIEIHAADAQRIIKFLNS